jgi:methyltransferase
MVSEAVFAGLVAALAVQRLYELRRSRANVARIRALGGREHAPGQVRWMVVVHSGWIVAMLVEVLVLGRPLVWPLALAAVAVAAVGQGLRRAAMRDLGWRWTIPVMTLPGTPPVTGGIYRRLRHPNYLGVVLEIAAVPLIHGAWITALVFSAANGLLLWRRIRVEEAALFGYDDALADRPLLWPGLRIR